MSRNHVTHGMYHTKFHRVWRGIKQRTQDKKFPKYKSYGGRGIKCEWECFERFKSDMYKSFLKAVLRYGEEKISIDRIDNDGNYCKKNCRWATNAEQAKNRRTNRYIKYKNIEKTITDWDRYLNICRGLTHYHLKRGLNIGEIINYYKHKKQNDRTK